MAIIYAINAAAGAINMGIWIGGSGSGLNAFAAGLCLGIATMGFVHLMRNADI